MQKVNHSRGLRFLSKLTFVITVGLVSAAIAYQASAQNVYTPPVGFYTAACTNGSDSLVVVPFSQIPAFSGTVAAIPGSTNEITVSGSPSWAANVWATPTTPNGYLPYYVQVVSNVAGTYVGAYYTVIGNDTAGDLYVGFANGGLASDNDLSGIAAGDYIQIIPFWQLGSVFTNGQGYVASTSSGSAGRHTLVLFPDLSSATINKAAVAQYYYFNNAWRRSSPPITAASNFNDVVIAPDQYVTVRNATNVADVTTFMGIGQVVTYPVRIPVLASGPPAVGQDNPLGIYRPATESLYQSGLTNPAFVASTSSGAAGRRDVLLVFDNTSQALNKSASQQFYYFNNGWRRSSPPTSASIDYSQSNIFLTTQGFIVRKTTNGVSGATLNTWVNPPNY